MSHVDEGALHAYLDGALDEYPAAEARRVREHLETCAICAERLAEERRVREDASAILDLAAPKVEVPTFEELRAYVRAGRSQRAALGRIHKMGWAASVVLALGTGWYLRGSDPLRTFEVERSTPAGGSLERAADEVVTEPAQAPSEPADPLATREAPAPPPATSAPLRAAAPERATANDVVVAGGRAEVAQAAPAPPAPAPAPAEPEVAKVADADAPAVSGAGAAGGAAYGFDDPQADAARVQARLDSAARAAESRRRVSGDPIVTTSTLDVAPAAPTLQRARAANEVERDRQEEENESLVVPGLEVLSVANLGEGTAFAGTRSLQRLANGDTLEVIHLPEGVEPALLAEPRAGWSQLVRQHADGWLVMRGPLGPIELEQLLERLEAGR